MGDRGGYKPRLPGSVYGRPMRLQTAPTGVGIWATGVDGHTGLGLPFSFLLIWAGDGDATFVWM
jgi:hypothetical protein